MTKTAYMRCHPETKVTVEEVKGVSLYNLYNFHFISIWLLVLLALFPEVFLRNTNPKKFIKIDFLQSIFVAEVIVWLCSFF